MSNQMNYHVLLTFEKSKELFDVWYLRNKSMLEMKYTLKSVENEIEKCLKVKECMQRQESKCFANGPVYFS